MFKLTVGVCVLVALLAGWLFFERARAQAALRQYERQLLARGEKLTFAEVTPPLPDGENRAVELANLSFQNGVVLPSHSPPVMRCIAPGKAWVVIGETEWFKEGIGRFTWQQLAEDLERNREVLDQLRAAVRSPVLRYPLNYRGITTLLPHLPRQKGLAQWLSGSALYNIYAGDIKDAVDDIEAIVNLTRLAEDEATLNSQLVRLAILAIAVDDCWPLLQCPRLPDSELARLQQIFERVDPITSMVLGFRGERAMGRDTVAIVRSAEIEIKDIVGQGGWFDDDQDPPQAIEKLPYGEEMLEALRVYVLYPAWRFAFSYADEKQLLVQMQSIIDGARAAKDQKSAAPLHSLDKTLRTKTAPGGELRSWRYLVTSLTVPHQTLSGPSPPRRRRPRSI